MRPIPLTRSSIAHPIVAFLARTGAPVERLLARAGLPPWILDDPEGLIPTLSVVRLLNQTARTEAIDNLGLLSGLEARIDALGVLGRLIYRAPTLGDALQATIRHHRMYSSIGGVWLTSHGEHLQLCQAFTNGIDDGWQQTNHYLLMLMLNVLRLAAGPTWWPAAVQLQTGESAALRDFEPLSATKIDFAQAVTAITFERALLDAPVRPPGDPGGLDPSIERWKASAPADDFAGSITQVVQTLSWEAYPHVQLTADVLGMSVRTLQRHLAEAGVTHELLIARARLVTAASLLKETDTRILEIALDLGYSDHAHFTRAFRRWTGRSPQEFRRECRSDLTAQGVSGS